MKPCENHPTTLEPEKTTHKSVQEGVTAIAENLKTLPENNQPRQNYFKKKSNRHLL